LKSILGIYARQVASNSLKPSDKYVTWDTSKLINPHVLLLGKTGAGKSHTIKEIVQQVVKNDSQLVRIHVIDVHGDLSIDPNNESTVHFSESTPYGLNPLKINPDPDYGGVRTQIQAFTERLERVGFRLGYKQKALLKVLLTDFYETFGIYENDNRTWKRGIHQKQPTLDDAVDFVNIKYKSLFIGSDIKTVHELEKLYKLKAKLFRKMKELSKAGGLKGQEGDTNKKSVLHSDIVELQDEIQKIIEEAKETFTKHLESVETGREFDDLIKYDASKEDLKSVINRMNNLKYTGVYRSVAPKFDENKLIWRYHIKAFRDPEKKLFVDTLLEQIYTNRLEEGMMDNVKECIILDEAHKFFTTDDENPVNKIAKEARKFGLGLIAASQSPKHFSEDFLSNVGTKILLFIDPLFWTDSINKLKVSEKALKWITPHQTFLATMSEKGVGSQGFIPIQVMK
jgi:DNA helicase HerA-like ATPase